MKTVKNDMFKVVVFAAVSLFTVQAASSGHLSRHLEHEGSFRLVDFIKGDFHPDASLPVLTRERRQSGRGSCGSWKWQCRDKYCIEWDTVCDGVVDCPDKSDETHAICGRSERCPAHLYRCAYGACVEGSAKCNNVKDCADESDELNKDCKRNSTVNAVNTCGKNKFQCLNAADKQCIDSDQLCDGVVDCRDKSDETVYQCANNKCASFYVRCAYGACVDHNAKCNNVVDCADASDEDPDLCRGVKDWVQQVTTVPPVPVTQPVIQPVTPPTNVITENIDPEGGCILPPHPEGGKYIEHNYPKLVPGQLVPQYSFLQYSCNFGYDASTPASPLCEEGAWLPDPSTITCNKKCKMVTSFTVDFTCRDPMYNFIPCAEKMPSGTIVDSKCKNGHILLSTEFLEVLKCGGGGSWDNPTPKCKPDCGLEKGQGVTYVVHGQTAKKDTFPWHVGIFQIEGEALTQVCGGSIIRSNVVATAGHCFWDEVKNEAVPAIYYKVAAGKFYRDWDDERERGSKFIQRSEVSKIIFHERYGGDEQNQQSDLALVVLDKPFSFSDSVTAVCFDMIDEDLNTQQTKADVLGKVAGWGRTETGQPSSELKTLTIPVIDYNQCRIELSKYKFTKYLTTDKMCAGYQNGSALCQGDSGGGFVVSTNDFKQRTVWFLRGIVSNGPLNDEKTTCRANTYTAFTQIYKLRDWALKQLRELS